MNFPKSYGGVIFRTITLVMFDETFTSFLIPIEEMAFLRFGNIRTQIMTCFGTKDIRNMVRLTIAWSCAMLTIINLAPDKIVSYLGKTIMS